jgi:heat-inducible transcriptional repressor
VLDNGRVLHEFLDPSTGSGCSDESRKIDPVAVTNYLMRALNGKTLEAACATVPAEDDPTDAKEALAKIVDFIRDEFQSVEETEVHTEGAGYIVGQPEFRDARRLEAVLSILEQRSALYKLFSSVYLGPTVTVIIGAENPLEEMRECSFVGSRYKIAGHPAGTIGVLGPTRMDYRRAVSAVDFMARNLGELLTALSVA